ncbi:hypothetical protein HF847_04865 [Clostridium cochlearium]|uniref:hypothetical protein n=1 Tax=Clostridium cochlearium TaxID=1494 RepID=UPI001459BDFE|nr:hypothetical protein [Clostridium cochlearium]NME95324.1 hypothetical protein [Clostridium cochlearium]
MQTKAFETMLESINAQIGVLVKNGYPIYDVENPEYFISGIRYDKDNDDVVFETMIDKSK